MRRTRLFPSLIVTAVFGLAACTPDAIPTAPDAASANGSAALQPVTILQQRGPNGRGMLWADGILFDVIVPPATFDNPRGPFDELYTGGNGFLDGVGAISEAKPGDADYNGGRWHVNVLKPGVDPDKYANASSVEDLDLADFEPTAVYFLCPMLPHGPLIGQGR